MDKFNISIDDFQIGEASDYANKYNLKGLYHSSCLQLRNMLLSPLGGINRRLGSKLVTPIQDNSAVRIIAFEHNNNSILMEIKPSVIRFYINGEPLIHDGDHYIIANFWTTEDQIKNLNYIYDDIMESYYFFSSNRIPSVLTFSDNYKFELKNIEYKDGPYMEINKTETTLKISGVTGKIAIESSENLFVKEDAMLDEERFVRIAHKGVWGVAKIVEFISETQVKATVISSFADTCESKDFRLGAWCFKEGYPSLATIFNGRMYYALTNKNKGTIWISQVGDYTAMSPSTQVVENNITIDVITQENSITLSLSKGKKIMWLDANKDNVFLGTQEGVFTITAINYDEAISPLNYTITKINSQKNSSHVVSTDILTFYADHNRENIYSIEVSQNKQLSLSQINTWSGHLFSSKVKEMIYLESPIRVLCLLMENGKLIMGNVSLNDNYVSCAWSLHSLGGNNTKIISITESYDNNNHYLWLLVNREIDNINKQFIEVITFCSSYGSYYHESQVYLDLYTRKDLINNMISDLEIFETEYLSVLTLDGIFLGNFQVHEGKINIQGNVYNDQSLLVGIPFDSIFQTPYLYDLKEKTLSNKRVENISLITYKSSHINLLDDKNNIIKENIINPNFNYSYYQEYNSNIDFNSSSLPSIIFHQKLPFAMNLSSINFTISNQL